MNNDGSLTPPHVDSRRATWAPLSGKSPVSPSLAEALAGHELLGHCAQRDDRRRRLQPGPRLHAERAGRHGQPQLPRLFGRRPPPGEFDTRRYSRPQLDGLRPAVSTATWAATGAATWGNSRSDSPRASDHSTSASGATVKSIQASSKVCQSRVPGRCRAGPGS